MKIPKYLVKRVPAANILMKMHVLGVNHVVLDIINRHLDKGKKEYSFVFLVVEFFH